VLVGIGSLRPLGGEQPFDGPPSVEEKFCWISCPSDTLKAFLMLLEMHLGLN